MCQAPRSYYRDISNILRKFRSFLLGRRHELEDLHLRYEGRLSPRSSRQPDIPKSCGYAPKYSKNYYYTRGSMDSVWPPVIAPVAEGPNPGKGWEMCGPFRAELINFPDGAPTPGPTWWWDGHCYFVETTTKPKPKDC